MKATKNPATVLAVIAALLAGSAAVRDAVADDDKELRRNLREARRMLREVNRAVPRSGYWWVKRDRRGSSTRFVEEPEDAVRETRRKDGFMQSSRSKRKHIPRTLDSGSVGSGVFRETSLGSGDSDYASFGYWMREGAGGLVNSVGAFVAGREFSTRDSMTLPPAGGATYSGQSVGLYTKKIGSGAGVDAGGRVVGRFTADATLRADFGAGGARIGGEVRNFHVQGAITYRSGRVAPYEARPQGTRVTLAGADVKADGSFAGETFMTDVEAGERLPGVIPCCGTWGGRFSSIADDGGYPRAVGGVFGAVTPGFRAGRPVAGAGTGIIGSFVAPVKEAEGAGGQGND